MASTLNWQCEPTGINMMSRNMRYSYWELKAFFDLRLVRMSVVWVCLDDCRLALQKWLNSCDLNLTSIFQIIRLFPSAAGLELTWSSVVKIGQSLYREAPGMDVFRPDQKTPVSNFFLSGSYTKQVKHNTHLPV